MTIKERILTFIKSEGISVRAFENASGLSNGAVSKMGDNTRSRLLEQITKAYPNLNETWLLTGEGEMLVNTLSEPQHQEMPTRPRIPLSASAGFLSGVAQGVSINDCELVPVIPGVPDYTCTIVVRGDSMEPRYESGDELALVQVRDSRSLQWGHVYIIDTMDGVILKRIYDNGDTLRCVSFNPDYPDSFVEKSAINTIWRVVALLRRF